MAGLIGDDMCIGISATVHGCSLWGWWAKAHPAPGSVITVLA
ncbi:hypothetical protein HMPREF9607_02097 [Cutibacterium modestum HL044PA1]|uniref:Uncharacterized protein n=1 Tax=Cutibacterium modestum HL044PA1 TaxID=765109 RepID=A0ABP2K704_9ACTN|nr:hypothetical protein HMPREF9607_02097 [Cutibacterium modestum HL044PA1]